MPTGDARRMRQERDMALRALQAVLALHGVPVPSCLLAAFTPPLPHGLPDLDELAGVRDMLAPSNPRPRRPPRPR